MPWVKLDDAFFDNDKIVAAGKDARDFYLAGLCYCARNLTDGFIPEERTGRLAIEAGIADGKEAVKRLCTVIRGKQLPLWEAVDGGYQVHDYLDYNPSKEEVLALREARAEAGRAGGVQSGEVRRTKRSKGEANALAKPKQTQSKNEAKTNPMPHVPGPMKSEGFHERRPTSAGQSNRKTERQAAAAAAEVSAPQRKPIRHQILFAVISREWGAPANDLTKGRYNRAAQNFEQAEVDPDDIPALKAAYRCRWPRMDCTPLAVAANVPTLRLPLPTGPPNEPKAFANIRAVVAEMESDDR